MKKIIYFIVSMLLMSYVYALDFSFVVTGDNRPSYKDQPLVYYDIVDEIAELKPDFIISTGDIIMGHTKDIDELNNMYADFLEASAKIKDIPFYIAPGNHEEIDQKELKPIFEQYFNETYQSFIFKNSYFILLDSDEPGEKNRITGEQLKWLKKELKQADNFEHIFVFVHRPLYSKITHIGNCLDKYPEDRDKLVSLLKKYNTEIVFTGHIHLYDYSIIDDLTQIIVGGSGAPLYADTYHEGGFNHFVYVKVKDEMTTVSVIPVENRITNAVEFYKQEEFQQAQTEIKKARTKHPEHREPMYFLSILYDKLDMQAEENNMLIKLNNQLNSKYDLYMRLAYFAYTNELYEAAEKYFLKTTELKPEEQESYYRLGRINQKKQAYQSALKFYQQSLERTENEFYRKSLQKRISAINEKLNN